MLSRFARSGIACSRRSVSGDFSSLSLLRTALHYLDAWTRLALEYFRWNQFLFCYVLTGTGNFLDLWSFGRHLATAQVSVRIGKGRKILRLYYPYMDVFRVRYSNCCFQKRRHPSVPLHFNAYACVVNCSIGGKSRTAIIL